MKSRRQFLSALGCAALACSPVAKAQQQTRVWRVGYLSAGSPVSGLGRTYLDAFRLKLRELGYIEGRNLIVDVRGPEGDFSVLPTMAAELVAMHPDVIVAGATLAVSAVQRATSSIPIVMGPTADPIGSGFIKSLAKPGGNITGLSLMSMDLSAKSLEFLTELVPKAKRIAVLKSTNPVHDVLIEGLAAAGQRLGLAVLPFTAVLSSELDEAFAAMAKANCEAVIVLPDPITLINATIPNIAAKSRLPAIYQVSGIAKRGGLLGYGPNIADLYGRAAVYVDKILKGANPAELPVEQPTKFDLIINLTTAKALGLDVPPTLLARADEVIE
jgi:ABC-type uncharacterized transport system substrate-binding protein